MSGDSVKLDPKMITLLLSSPREGLKWEVIPKSPFTAAAKLVCLRHEGVLGHRDIFFVYAGDDHRDGRWFRLYTEVDCFFVKLSYEETAQRAE